MVRECLGKNFSLQQGDASEDMSILTVIRIEERRKRRYCRLTPKELQGKHYSGWESFPPLIHELNKNRAPLVNAER